MFGGVICRGTSSQSDSQCTMWPAPMVSECNNHDDVACSTCESGSNLVWFKSIFIDLNMPPILPVIGFLMQVPILGVGH